MCYFLTIAVAEDKFDASLIDQSGVDLTEITREDLGEAVLGGRLKGTAFLITEGGCSCDLVGATHAKGKDEVEHIKRIIADLARVSRSISVLIHIAQGALSTDALPQIEKRRIRLKDFLAAFPKISKDVRYVLT